jgi:hypothetical protein
LPWAKRSGPGRSSVPSDGLSQTASSCSDGGQGAAGLCETRISSKSRECSSPVKSFVKLPTAFATSRPQRRGAWRTEACAAGAYSFLGAWKRARQSWLNCLLGLAELDDDREPMLRKLAALGVAADDHQTGGAVVGWLAENETEMRRIWELE